VGVISSRISVCYFPLPLVPSRRGRGKFTFYDSIMKEGLEKWFENQDNGVNEKSDRDITKAIAKL